MEKKYCRSCEIESKKFVACIVQSRDLINLIIRIRTTLLRIRIRVSFFFRFEDANKKQFFLSSSLLTKSSGAG